ncbi:MAG: RluA family pseudouridine synthase [Mariprofundaceae bacterium]|nr:RluA family pseudouridine synthase [Mariprofundaceae bacterium]
MASHQYDNTDLLITQDEEGSRLDRAIFRSFPHSSRTLIMRLIRKGNLRVNGKRAKPNQHLDLNDKIFIPASLREQDAVKLIAKPIKKLDVLPSILYEDADILVLNKVGGTVVHAGSGYEYGLIEQLRESMELPQLGLAHRLDRDTSGCLLLAKHLASLRKLTQSFREKEAQKTYLAWVDGQPFPTASQINHKLSKGQLKGGERMVISDEDGVEALTDYQLISRAQYHKYAYGLVALKPHTGRTHQLRVHLQSQGHAILGDNKYGQQKNNQLFKKIGGKGMALHAWQLQFSHPITHKTIQVRAPYPNWWNNISNYHPVTNKGENT